MTTTGGARQAADEVLFHTDLGRLGPLLGAGGQAKVFALPSLRLPDVPGPLVYKEYKPGQLQHGPRHLVTLRNGLPPTRQATLDEITAWPVRQVMDESRVTGMVLPQIPDPFFVDLRLPSKTRKRVPCEVQFLFIPPDKAQLLDTPIPSPTQRLEICRDFAAALAFLHDELDVVFGDINARNALFRLDAHPMVMFVDCDAARRVGTAARVAALNAPDWEPPGDTSVLSKSTDLYKLGLFVLRCLTPAEFGSVNRDAAMAKNLLDSSGLAMLTDALGPAADRRPVASQWVRYLNRLLGHAPDPPRLSTVDVDRTVVPAGQPVVVSWSATDADRIEITAAGLLTVTVGGSAGSGRTEVHPTRTGPLTVTASNSLATDSRTTRPVVVFDVASVQVLPVPLPQFTLPALDVTALPELDSILPPLPVVPAPPIAVVADGAGWPGPESMMPAWPTDPDGPPSLDEVRWHCPIDITSIMTGGGYAGFPDWETTL